jgi:hypothetical protein
MGETLQKIGRIILLLALLVLMFFAIAFAWTKIGPWFKSQRSSSLDTDTKDQLALNFQNFVENIQKCAVSSNTDCICYGFPGYPATFHSNAILVIDKQIKNITLYDKKEQLKTQHLDNLPIEVSSINLDSTLTQLNNPPLMRIVFSGETPKIQELKDGYISSKYLLKKGSSIHLITFAGKPGFWGERYNPNEEEMKAIEEILKKKPQC